MYFSNYGLRKTCLDKCLKTPISENPSTSDMVSGQNRVEIRTVALLQDLLIPVKTI